jgi:cobalamin biosynthesis protein CobT
LGYLWDRKINPKTGVVMYHVKFDSTDFFTTAEFLDFEGDRDNISDLMQRRQNGQENEEEDSNSDEEAKKSSSDKGEGGPPKKEKSTSSGSQKTTNKKKKGGVFQNAKK